MRSTFLTLALLSACGTTPRNPVIQPPADPPECTGRACPVPDFQTNFDPGMNLTTVATALLPVEVQNRTAELGVVAITGYSGRVQQTDPTAVILVFGVDLRTNPEVPESGNLVLFNRANFWIVAPMESRDTETARYYICAIPFPAFKRLVEDGFVSGGLVDLFAFRLPTDTVTVLRRLVVYMTTRSENNENRAVFRHLPN